MRRYTLRVYPHAKKTINTTQFRWSWNTAVTGITVAVLHEKRNLKKKKLNENERSLVHGRADPFAIVYHLIIIRNERFNSQKT